MRPYNEYEKIREKYEEVSESKEFETYEDLVKLEPSDYVLFGNLMKEITESVKSRDGREQVLSRFGNEEKGYTVKTKLDLLNLMAVAICLSAALDRNVSDDKLFSLAKEYHDPHGFDAFRQYKNVAEAEMAAEKIKQQ